MCFAVFNVKHAKTFAMFSKIFALFADFNEICSDFLKNAGRAGDSRINRPIDAAAGRAGDSRINRKICQHLEQIRQDSHQSSD